ncbi:MAG: DUF4358 domain-containing protein [Oscillospiraceae bacterium]|nr:DUF4358 domain-containing protein [Oscillospiraceae bacterium]
MNKLKIFSVIMAILTVAALTACGNESDSIPEETSSLITAGEETPEEPADTEGDLIDDEEEIDIDELFPNGVPDNSGEAEVTGENGDTEEEAANPLMPIIDAVLAESEWPVMAEVTDEMILKDYFLIDPASECFEQLIVMQCPMSAQMSEIIIIKAGDGDLDEKTAWETLNDRQRKAIETDAWYPADKELADASIVNRCGNYVYFIIGVNAEAAEESITNYLYANFPATDFGVWDND